MLRKEKLAEFRAFMESALAEDVANSRHEHELFIDGAVSARSVTVEFADDAEPRRAVSAAGNPEPVIALPAHQLVYADKWGRRICACASSPAMARSSTALRSARSDKSSATR